MCQPVTNLFCFICIKSVPLQSGCIALCPVRVQAFWKSGWCRTAACPWIPHSLICWLSDKVLNITSRALKNPFSMFLPFKIHNVKSDSTYKSKPEKINSSHRQWTVWPAPRTLTTRLSFMFWPSMVALGCVWRMHMTPWVFSFLLWRRPNQIGKLAIGNQQWSGVVYPCQVSLSAVATFYQIWIV